MQDVLESELGVMSFISVGMDSTLMKHCRMHTVG